MDIPDLKQELEAMRARLQIISAEIEEAISSSLAERHFVQVNTFEAVRYHLDCAGYGHIAMTIHYLHAIQQLSLDGNPEQE